MKHNPFTHPAARPTNTWRQTIIYYSLHISMAAAIGFAITDSWGVALAVSMIEPAVQVLAWLTQQWEQRVQNHSIQQDHL